jgi:hypothetical protein
MEPTRHQAILRLLKCWACCIGEDRAYARRVSVSDVLAKDVIQAVIRQDLLSQFEGHANERKAARFLVTLTQMNRAASRKRRAVRSLSAPHPLQNIRNYQPRRHGTAIPFPLNAR